MRELLSFFAIAGIIGLAYGVLRIAAWLRAAQPSDSPTVRGRKLLDYGEVLDSANRDFQESVDPRAYPWGGTPVTAKAALGHFVAVGAPGSGKTILLRTLLREVLRQLNATDRCIVFDMKGDFWPFVHEQCSGNHFTAESDAILLHPFCDSTPAWDIARDAGPLDADSVCAGLLPLTASDKSPHFVMGARQLMASVIAAFRALNSDWTLWDLLVACSSAKNLQLLAKASKLTDITERLAHKGDETGSVVATLSTATHHLRIPAALWKRSWLQGNRFALSDWIADRGPRVLVLGYDTSKKASLQPIVQAVLSRVISELLGGPEHEHAPKTWVFLDELPFAGRVDNLADFLNGGRSKGVAAVLGTQSVNMLNIPSLYPGTETPAVLANPTNRAFLRTQDNETAQWMANQLGKREAYESGFSSSEGRSQQGGRSAQSGTDSRIQERFIIHPDDLKDIASPSERQPLTGAFESAHGVWTCSIPPQHFPGRPQGGLPVKADAEGISESLQWSDEDLTRLHIPRSPKTESDPAPTQRKPGYMP